MRELWSSIILVLGICHVGFLRPVAGQNYYYFHRTNHPSIFQSANDNYQLPQPIALQKYSVPAPAPLFNSPFTSNFYSRSTYETKPFQPPSNLNIISNSATFPHAYVPVKQYTPIQPQQNFISQFPAQSYYPVYNAPAPVPVPIYTQPQPQLANFQVSPKLKPLRPLRPLAAIPEYFQVSNPAPVSTLKFGKAVYQQPTLNVLPQYYQIKQLYTIKNEKPGVTGYSYSLGNNDQVTSTITVNFGSSKRYEPIGLAPQKSFGLGVVSTQAKEDTPSPTTASAQIPPAEQGESQANTTTAVLYKEEEKPETTNPEPAADADFGKGPLVDQGELDPAKDNTGQDEQKDFPDLKSPGDETVPEVADADINNTPQTSEQPVITKGIEVMLQPPSEASPPLEPTISNADNDSKNEEIPLVESYADKDDAGIPTLPDASPAEPSEASPQGQPVEAEGTNDSSSSTLSSVPRADEDVEKTANISPPEYDYFTDPDIAQKEIVEVRSLDTKNPPKSQALEPLPADVNPKLTSDHTTTEIPSSSSTDLGLLIPENVTEAKESTNNTDSEVAITTEPPQGDTSSDVDKETLAGTKIESSFSMTVTSSSSSGSTETPVMTTISNRTIEIDNRKVRVVIKRRVSRPARRTRFPLVLPLPREF